MVPIGRLIAVAALFATVGVGGLSVADDTESAEILALVNQARWDNGQVGVVRDPALDSIAANWAQQMAAANTLSHNPDLSTQVPPGWTALGENVAQGQPDAAAVHQAWMDSPGHRANVLGDYTDIGVAFLSASGTTWAVEVFARYDGHTGVAPPQPSTPDPQPTQIVDPSAKPTFTLPPTPTPSASPHSSPSTGHPWVVVGIVACGVFALVAVLGVLALMRWTQSRK